MKNDKSAKMNKAWLATSTGLILQGRSCGANGTATGELVFNTSMSGYQELITDFATTGQVLVFTMTQIGNYGVNAHDVSSGGVHPSAVVARDICDEPSNWASEGSLPDYLAKHGVLAIDQIDTRLLTRNVRDHGPVKAVVTTVAMSDDELIKLASDAETSLVMNDAELMAQEMGARLTRLPVGHRASNIPVKDLRTSDVLITAQHHGYDINLDGVDDVEVTHVNLNDDSVEGFIVTSTGDEYTLFRSLELRELITPDMD